MSDPVDHHYLPIFHLSRWAGADGYVCRFSRPYGDEVNAKRVVPKGTGFEPMLYQDLEKVFMSKLDAAAAEALELLERGLPEKDWTSGRSAWSRFVHTQMPRAPEDLAQLTSTGMGESDSRYERNQIRHPTVAS